MAVHEREIIKRRDIAFCELHPDPDQAETAALVLQDLPGVVDTERVSATQISVRYNVLEITLRQIESLLSEVGFHLGSKLIHRLKRSLHYYTEETQRANNGIDGTDRESTQKIFIERYTRLSHGCRDGRPNIWRHYR